MFVCFGFTLNIVNDETDDDEYSSTTEEYESVASIGDYIQSYSPKDRAEIAREIIRNLQVLRKDTVYVVSAKNSYCNFFII